MLTGRLVLSSMTDFEIDHLSYDLYRSFSSSGCRSLPGYVFQRCEAAALFPAESFFELGQLASTVDPM